MAASNFEQTKYGLYSMSSEFLQAAKILNNKSAVHLKCNIVVYYLLGHASELMLKSLLVSYFHRVDDLKRFGHNLKLLIKEVESKTLLRFKHNEILLLSSIYASKGLEYRDFSVKKLPDLNELMTEVDALQRLVFDRVFSLR